MNIKTIEYKNLNEVVYSYTHKSGLKAFVIPKKGYLKKYATFATHYGSVNNRFSLNESNNVIEIPDGVAHFLEHKLFEQKDGSVMDKFSKLGSNPNAYTSFAQTVYLFSCTERFKENLKLLLDFVQNPYITDESIEKERHIIAQEIKMYEDNANWRVFFNLLDALYKKHPVKVNIAGSIESISKIDRDVLYTCYDTFYHPSNMLLLVVGDVDPKEVFMQIDEGISKYDKKPDIKRLFPKEQEAINTDYVEQKLAVSIPIFQMGFKDTNFQTGGIESLKREVAVKISLGMLMGRSSEFYNRLYKEGLINNTFGFDYTIEEDYAYSAFGGESQDPFLVKEKLIKKIEELQNNGLNRDDYERVKRAMNGRFIKQLNSVEGISHMFISVHFRGANMFDYFKVYSEISFEYVEKMFKQHFNIDKLALSVIRPI
ncbi:MAG: insulinase family protein [Clostridium sp.]|nr:insulinase family protein [Clostridium sp.]